MVNENKSARVARHVSPIPFCRVWRNGIAKRQNEAQKSASPSGEQIKGYICLRACLVIILLSWHIGREIMECLRNTMVIIEIGVALVYRARSSRLYLARAPTCIIISTRLKNTRVCIRAILSLNVPRWYFAWKKVLVNSSRKSWLTLQMNFSETLLHYSVEVEWSFDIDFSFRQSGLHLF